jgi:ribosome-binding protein aMBF1 (putative translation factor)
MSKIDLKKFAAIVRAKRAEKGWSQEKLGHESGLSTNTVFSIEHAKPTVRRSRASVCAALDIEEP